MKAIGIVAEFNPFHQGHAYLIRCAKERTGADYAIVTMSGDFVQRGTPACMDKYTRTRMALSMADVVIGLPCLYATASAEYFAQYAVRMLVDTGVVDCICFGTEHPDFPFETIADILMQKNEQIEESIRSAVASGLTYPAARAAALSDYCLSHKIANDFAILEALSEPNTILGIEYTIAALRHHCTVLPIARIGHSYHDNSTEGEYLSASAIRTQLLATESPEPTERKYVSETDMNALVFQALLAAQKAGYDQYLDCDKDLSNRICKLLPQYTDFVSFAHLLKSKNYTYTRICRVLLHIMLNIKNEDMHYAPYYRVLGFRMSAQELLSQIKKTSSVPLITKPASAQSLLHESAYSVFELDLYAAALYEQMACQDFAPRINEMQQSPIIIP